MPRTRTALLGALLAAGLLTVAGVTAAETGPAPLGLPPVPIPADNPQTKEKIALGDRLFHDTRFSSTGAVSCSSCHLRETGFTDSPRPTSAGINGLIGTRNAPTVINAAYSTTMFWDGRSPDLEDQALHPFVNPIEMGLTDHQAILDVIKGDRKYKRAFKRVFARKSDQITMREVTMAIAAFERTAVAGNSPFDRWFFAGDGSTWSAQQERGYDLFVGQARCVSCHVIEQTQALFTDNRFHNIGVGINSIQDDVPELAGEFLAAERTLEEVDREVLSDARTSELGRFAVSRDFDGLGAFKTPTLRNVTATGPYMHDGSLATLAAVVEHYNNGGVSNEGDPVNDFLSSGIRPLNLSDAQIADLIAFMEGLTSPEYASQAN